MDLHAVTKPSGPVSSEAFDEREVYSHVRKSFGFHFLDTLPVKIFKLLEPDRQHFLGTPLCDRLKRDTDNWDIYRITNARESFDKRSPDDLAHSMALSYRRKAESSKDMPATPDKPKSLGYNWKYGHSTDLKLPKADRFEENTLISVFNSEEKKTLVIQNHEERTHLNLESWKGLILERTTGQNGKPVWRKGAEFGAVKDQFIQSNPLVFDIPRVFDTTGKPLPHPVTEGELYPTSDVVQDLFELKHGTRPEVFRTSEEMIPWMKTLQEDGAVSFIVQHSFAAHMIAARIIRKGDHLVCYLHETLDGGNKHSEGIYKEVTKALERAFPTMNRVILSPAFESQKDFSSCGVFTEKTLNALAKPENKLDPWLLKQAAPDKPLPDTHERKRTTTNHLMIDLVDYPAVLLKLYQGSSKDLDRVVPDDAISPHVGKNLMDVVVHREKMQDGVQLTPAMTLRQYREYHSHKGVPNYTGTGAAKVDCCLVSTGKRYKMLMLWRDHFLSNSDSTVSTTETPSLSEPSPPRERSHDRTPEEPTISPSESNLSSELKRVREEHSYSLSPDYCPPSTKKKPPATLDQETLQLSSSTASVTSNDRTPRRQETLIVTNKFLHKIREKQSRDKMHQAYQQLLSALPSKFHHLKYKVDILNATISHIQERHLPSPVKRHQEHFRRLKKQTKDQKYQGHLQNEQKRRSEIAHKLNKLGSLLPKPQSKKKRSQLAILTDAATKVQEMNPFQEPLTPVSTSSEDFSLSRVGSAVDMEAVTSSIIPPQETVQSVGRPDSQDVVSTPDSPTHSEV
ncbi:helix-loop-helix domain-containing protein [Endozoicomonas arenosclerae]|uniref:helix-loop-helix domain-containing protein n=1 Tax=Endozoicomonas arenosclerae TaxID=1633495 RepID=UPI0007837999|nr:helix-loop-helix domain-containing protein [Endozoicomonas arenosclerae]